MKRRKEIDSEKKARKSSFCFECLGVKIGFRSNNINLLENLRKKLPEVLPIEFRKISEPVVEHWFSVFKADEEGQEYEIFKESKFVLAKKSVDELMNYLETQIRSTVAEFAKDFVFLHAGVVSWKGKGIVIPGKTFTGKTTLVSELIKRNCEYLSDEFAVIDRQGFVHPFPKKLSMRGIIDDYRQLDLDVAECGGRKSKKPVPVNYFLLTEFQKDWKKPKIKINSSGEGVMAGVANSISVRQNPKFVLEVLSVVAKRALVLRTKRGEAGEFADFFLEYLEKIENSSRLEKTGRRKIID